MHHRFLCQVLTLLTQPTSKEVLKRQCAIVVRSSMGMTTRARKALSLAPHSCVADIGTAEALQIRSHDGTTALLIAAFTFS